MILLAYLLVAVAVVFLNPWQSLLGEDVSADLHGLFLLAARSYQRLAENPPFLFLLVGTSVLFIATTAHMTFLGWRSRLLLDSLEIRYQSPYPPWMGWIDSSWAMRWGDIGTARIPWSSFNTIPGGTLRIDGPSGRRRISVYSWAERAHRHESARGPFQRAKPAAVKTILEQQPVVQGLRARGIDVKFDLGRGSFMSRGFDLGGNRHAVLSLVLFAALAIYAGIEFFLPGRPMDMNLRLLGACAAAGVFIALCFATWLYKSKVPVFESVVIALSMGSTSTAVLYFTLPGVV